MAGQNALLETALAYTPYRKTVLITGGTKGIGRAVIEELGPLECLIFTCSRNKVDLDELLEFCSAKGWKVDGIVADVSIREDRVKLVKAVADRFNNSLDVLVNNVGTNIRKPAITYTEEDYHKIYSTNIESAIFMSTLCHDLLVNSTQHGGGVIVMNSSVAGGPLAMKSGVLYGSTKAAMNHAVRHLACEWAPHSIRVVGVAPWYTETPLALQVLKDEEFNKQVLSRTPVGRTAKPVEVAKVMCFLMSNAASYVTGHVVAVDGGYSVMGLFP